MPQCRDVDRSRSAKLDRLARDAHFLLARDAHFLLGLQKADVAFMACDMPDANRMTARVARGGEGEFYVVPTSPLGAQQRRGAVAILHADRVGVQH